MISSTRALWISVPAVLALVALPWIAASDAMPSRATTESRTGVSRPAHPNTAARVIPVDENFTRHLADNCDFSGSLRGSVREYTQPSGIGGEQYSPNLTLSGRVSCRDGFQVNQPATSITGERLTALELEQLIKTRGQLSIQHGGRVCMVIPDFAWHSQRLVAGDTFTQACQYARGGGPAPSGPQSY